ncbi:hypothetical protein RQP46_006389 [Phenoliferia psychrophenolica]
MEWKSGSSDPRDLEHAVMDPCQWHESKVDPEQWKGFAETLYQIFGEIQSFVHEVPLPSDVKFAFICDGLCEIIRIQITRQTRVEGSFHSLLPSEVIKIIIGMAYENEPAKVDLALVHPVWRDIALPLMWRDVAVELDHDAEVQFFAKVARGTSYHTRNLTKLTLDTVTLSDPFDATLNIPFRLQSLRIEEGHLSRDLCAHFDTFLTAITPGSSTTLERLSLDSPAIVQTHLPSLSRSLVEISLTQNVQNEPRPFLGLDPATLDLRALRKLRLPMRELESLLATPSANQPPDAPRSTIAQAIPQLEHLVLICDELHLESRDLENLERLLSLPLCNTLKTLELEDAEVIDSITQSEMEVFRRTLVLCGGRGVVIKVNDERLC